CVSSFPRSTSPLASAPYPPSLHDALPISDQAERRRRDQKLYHLAVDARGAGGFGVELEAFKAAWTACRAAYQAGPTAFLEQNLETGSWFSAAALMAQPLPELHYVVEGFLPQGLALLASPPKYGKSWLAMQL